MSMERSTPILLTILLFLITTFACSIGLPSPPTPGPFPVEGVRQKTSDYAFYQNLMWSPTGKYIAATRCPVMKYQPVCYEHEEAILIDSDTGYILTIDLQSITSNRITGYPLIWSPDGARLLLLVEERIPEEGSSLSHPYYHKMAYTLTSHTLTNVEITGGVIAWNKDDTSILMIHNIKDDMFALGWFSLDSSEFQQEIPFTNEDRMYWPYALSPDERTLLRSDSPFTTSCVNIESYTIGSHKPFSPFLSLACFPAWSPDGSKLAYTSKASAGDLPNRLIISNADGSDPVSLFPQTTPHELAYPTWSPDGRYIAFTFGAVSGANAIYIVDVPEHLQPSSE